MLKITTTNIYSKLELVNATPQDGECVGDIYNHMRLFNKNVVYSEKYNMFTSQGTRVWDGFTNFFSIKTGAFLTGHLPFILEIITKHNVEYSIIDKCFKPSVKIAKMLTTVGSFKLRNYQLESIEIATQKNRGVFNLCTGSGKTVCALGITERIPVKTLFLVDRVELLNQTYKVFNKNSSASVGIINSSTFEPRDITIGMQKTIWFRLKNKYSKEEMLEYLNTVEMVFADETHHASSSTWKDVLKCLPNAYYRYGLSGTALTTDAIRNMYLIGYIGKIVQVVSNDDLINLGFLAKPLIKMVSLKTKNSIMSDSVYEAIYQEGITHNKERNEKIVNIVQSHPNKSILVVVKSIFAETIFDSTIVDAPVPVFSIVNS
jgi:superfamily II DNA or RNA helicase